jgi:putative redox protein
MALKLTWTEGLMFVATDELGHSMVLDAISDAGGSDAGFRPVDLLVVSLAACMAMDIVSILKKMRSDLRSLKAEMEGERATDHPRRLTHIRIRFRANPEVKLDDIRTAMELSRDKYCSVLGTLANAPQVGYEVAT